MNCDMNNEILMAYLDGELSPLDRGRVAEHIVACGACRATVNHLREVAAALSRWTVPEPAALPTAAELLASAGVVPAAPPRPAPLRGAPRWAVAAALALAASAIGIVAVKVAVDSGETRVAQAPAAQGEATPTPATGSAPGVEPAPTQDEPEEPEEAAEPPPAAREQQPAAADGTIGRVDAPPPAEPVPATAPGGEAAAQAPVPGSEAVGVTANEAEASVAPPPPPAAPTVAPREEARAERDAAADDDAKAGGSLGAARRAPLAAKQRAASTLIRSAKVTLQSREPGALAGRVSQYARSAGGRVAKRSRLGRDGAVEVTVEVPADQFDRVYAQIKGLGTVRSEMLSNRDAADRLEQIDAELADRREGAEDLSRGRRPPAAQLESERVRLLDQVRRGTITVTIASGE